MIDVPATSGLSFIGEQSEMERIVWDIQEDFLFAYRSYPWLDGADGRTRPGTGAYQGSPIAAFPITSHFDVQRQYNPATGEQTNVIVENASDRPWYQREYMRVDWSRNAIADFKFHVSAATQQTAQTTIDIPNEDDKGANKDRPKISENYIDIVNTINAAPELDPLYTSYFGFPILSCWLYSNIYNDCSAATLKVRNSFMRVEPSTYQPIDYDDLRFQKFGIFRASERYTYNEEYGVLDSGMVRRPNRWNMWKSGAADCYNPQSDLPYSSCNPEDLRSIVYYLNEDFPEEYKYMALDNGEEWNRVWREAIKSGTGWSDAQIDAGLNGRHLFRICANNPVQADDPVECGEAGLNPQIGDLRYSMYYYVPNEQASSPLGYGPSAADPLTGEVIQANAFYYGAAGKWIAARTRDIVKVQLGIYDPEDISSGAVSRAAVKLQERSRKERMEREPLTSERYNALTKKLGIQNKAKQLRNAAESGLLSHDKRPGRLESLKNSPIDNDLVSTEMRQAFAVSSNPDMDLESMQGVQGLSTFLAPEFFARNEIRSKRLLNPRAGGCVLMAEDVIDDGLQGLTSTVRAKFYDVTVNPPVLKAGFTERDVYDFIVAQTMADTQLHEIGHTMSLRHNFSASTDALNFGPEYWALKGPGYSMGPNDKRPFAEFALQGFTVTGHEQALNEGIRDLQSASVMDYANVYGTNTSLGSYDLAAIKYAYFDMIEVFNSPDITNDRAQLLRQGELHYTFYPEVVSNAATYQDRVNAMYDRRNVNFRKVEPAEGNNLFDANLVPVPYSFCSDEYNGASATCSTWDQGVDNFERTQYAIDVYRNYQIFNTFKRDRMIYGVDLFGYLSRVYSRSFTPILNQYKNWVNDELIIRSDRTCVWFEDGQRQEDASRFTAVQCGGAGFQGAVEATNFFAEVIEAPDVGCYTRLKPGCYEAGTFNDTGISDREVIKVSSDPDFCDTYVASDDNNKPLKITENSPYQHVRDSTSCSGWVPFTSGNETITEAPVELGIPEGARFSNTLYDRNQYGYYFYWKPTVMGSWWDKWLAVKALGDPETDFIGVDASSDTRSFLISLSTIFGDPINNMVGGLVTDRTEAYGPILNPDGTVKVRPAIDSNGNGIDPTNPGGVLINPDQQYTLRLVAMFNTAFQGQSIDDYEFGEGLYVGRYFNVDDLYVPANIRNNPELYTELTDPVTGYKWFSVRAVRPDGSFFYSAGYEFIRQIKDKYYEGGADGPGLVVNSDNVNGARGDIRILNIMRTTAEVFGYSDVWSGDLGI